MQNELQRYRNMLQITPRFATGRILNDQLQPVGYCGVNWHDRIQDIISDIEQHRYNYYSLVETGAAPSRIIIVRDDPPYLRTEADDNQDNNLQYMPTCCHRHSALYCQTDETTLRNPTDVT